MYQRCLLLFLFLLAAVIKPAVAQDDDLLSMLEDSTEQIDYATASFKSTRVVSGHSIENVSEGVLDFRISHRFGRLNGGAYEFYGLDQATIRLGFEYGVTDRFMIGVGRSSWEKAYDGFMKVKLLRQSTGKVDMPVTMSYFSSMAINTLRFDTTRKNFFTSRLFYTHQLIIGRKFSESFTLQLMPTFIHRNLVATRNDFHDIYALGIAGRIKLSRRVSFNGEYFFVMPGQLDSKMHNSCSIGFDIETGGHVFQLHFTNSPAMIEKEFIAETEGDWLKGDIHFGFNISRVFTVKDRRHKS
jgi:hypothetical protein